MTGRDMNGKLQLAHRSKAKKAFASDSSSVENRTPDWIRIASNGIRFVWTLSLAAVLTVCLVESALASEITESIQSQVDQSGSRYSWGAILAFLSLPAIALIGYSLVVNQRKGWGWIVVGLVLILILSVLQFFWMIITSFRGDPLDNEDYFTPTDSWSSDSF